jgi:hypothetical protein
VAAAVGALAERAGSRPVTVDGDHEIYMTDPTVLTGVVGPP